MLEENPKLFLSYSWSSPEHEQWVLTLATELCENGVDVILDKWHLKEGHDAYAFMEQMVTDPGIKKVALICDRLYAEKADGRNGGVGTEAQILSPAIYEKAEQTKFVAVVVEKTEEGKAYLPTYYRSRKYLDLSDPDRYATNFEQLLRWIYDKPLYMKPELGKKPAFLSDSAAITLGTTTKFKRALDAVRNNKEYCKGAVNEYFATFTQNLERFRLTERDGEFDDHVMESIEQFLPYRNEAIEMFLALAQYRDTSESHQQLHRFFEGLIPYLDRPEHLSSCREWDFDNFKFIVHELFLYLVACLFRYECFSAVAYLVRHHYYSGKNPLSGRNPLVPFSVFRQHVQSLDYRNERLKLRRLSLHADLLEQRAKGSGFTFPQLMQADFVLFLRDGFESLPSHLNQSWWPHTLLYMRSYEAGFEMFARAQSKEYFEKVKCLFDIQDKKDFEPLLQAFQAGTLHVPKWQGSSFSPAGLLGYEKLATRP